MVRSVILRSIAMVLTLCARELQNADQQDDVALAVFGDVFGTLLESIGIWEPILEWLSEILMALYARLQYVNSLRFRPTFIRPELQWPGQSAALHTLRQRNDAGYMLLVRVDVATFDWIVHLVSLTSPEWTDRRNQNTRYNLNATLCIAAALAWLGSNCTQKWLQQAFGNTRSTMSRDLKHGLHHLLIALRTSPQAQIRWPAHEDMPWLHDLICQGRDSLPPISQCRVFGWLDGFRSRILQPGTVAEQSDYYNGWVGDTSVVSLFGFLPTGKIFYASMNHPGRAHDKSVCADFVQKLLSPRWTPRDMGVLADSAFCSPRLCFKVWTRKRPSNWPHGFASESQWTSMVNWMTGSRQAAEWGMRALRGRWARLNAPMPNNRKLRGDLLELVALLHNVVSERIGANQIRSVYLEAALRHANNNADVRDIAADFF
jgi:hypothetical protein